MPEESTMPEEDQEAQPRKVYLAGDFRALSLGREFDTEYWWNPILGNIEPFVGAKFSESGNEPCEVIYPRDEDIDIPEVVYREQLDDGGFKLKFSNKETTRGYVDYRFAIALLFLPYLVLLIKRFIQRNK